MREVPARGKAKSHERVAWRHQGHEGGGIGGRAGMGLDVCEFTPKKLRNSFYRKGFRNIHELAAAIIAPRWQPLGILVGEYRALRLQDCRADDVFRCNQLDLV